MQNTAVQKQQVTLDRDFTQFLFFFGGGGGYAVDLRNAFKQDLRYYRRNEVCVLARKLHLALFQLVFAQQKDKKRSVPGFIEIGVLGIS